MDNEGVTKSGSESQDSEELGLPGTSKPAEKSTVNIPIPSSSSGFKLKPSLKGVENAKKRLRAFSIQKKTPITPAAVKNSVTPTVSTTSNSTVLIGKLSGVKATPKPDDAEQKQPKPPKPPKPGQNKKSALQELPYTVLRERTLSEIEDMKRKMELIELGIPLGLICPTSTRDKAMPTKAMPPIKSFLDQAKLDEIIREAKRAKAEGREFKFDYQKVLPDYDNPFQRKKDECDVVNKVDVEKDYYKKPDKDREERRKIDRYDRDFRRHSSQSQKRDEKDKRKDKIDRYRNARRDTKKSVERETDVNLSDYLVCDSWSLDNEDKANSSSPKRQDTVRPKDKSASPSKEKQKETEVKVSSKDKEKHLDNPKAKPTTKIEKLHPVIDSFKYELDSNDEEVLDIFDENCELQKFSKVTQKKDEYDSTFELFEEDQNSKYASNDALTDDTFLEAVINEIKQEGMSDEEASHDKGLVEYDSPSRDSSPKDERISVTPELNDRMRDLQSQRSDYSDGYRSIESGYKSTESGYRSSGSHKSESRSDSYRMSMNNDLTDRMPKSTVDSLETWSFVLKICQPLLFRHDRNKCYRESRSLPKIWYTENPKTCTCVKDRSIVYEELETCKMNLVDRVYGCDQIQESVFPKERGWYPRFAQCLTESNTVPIPTSTEWEADDSQTEILPGKGDMNMYKAGNTGTPLKSEEISLDREYQRFMQAVWPEVVEAKATTPRSTTPVKQEPRKKKAEEIQPEEKKKAKKIKLSSEGWSQESDIEEEMEKTKKLDKISKIDKVKLRKRKLSTSSVTDSDKDSKRRRKINKKKGNKKSKSKLSQRQRLSKKYLMKLKEKQKKRSKKQISEDEDIEKESKKKEKKLKKKKNDKKKKAQKKKKAKAKSSSSSSSTSSTDSSSDTESSVSDQRKKKKKKTDIKKKKHKETSSESSQSEDLFDENILNNIKTERLTDDEKKMEFSPRKQKPREIINVKELQNDFVGSVQIKQEVEDKIVVEKEETEQLDEVVQKEEKESETAESESTESLTIESVADNGSQSLSDVPETVTEQYPDILLEDIPIPTGESQFKEPIDMNRLTISEPIIPETTQPEESNLSLCSSQDSSISKDPYEKDDSHLRPSSQNSNYSFHDVITASQNYQKEEDDKFELENYEQGNYEMYEQLAMAYQSDVAKGKLESSPAEWWESQRIETVVRARARGEIKCDWRAGDSPAHPAHRPSRWGLKPGEVNIVLTGGNNEQYTAPNVIEPVYKIQTLANNRADNSSTGSYDEAYEDMYGASDRLQYGNCFSTETPQVVEVATVGETKKPLSTSTSFDDRIDQALRTTVLGEVAKVTEETDKDGPEKGILVTKPESRGAKRVSFADGYKPGQDSDVEEPPKRKKKPRRFGCAWPCPATHPDHVPLWDALPPPPPPPGSPPPALSPQIPQMISQTMLLQQPPSMLQQPRPPLSQQPQSLLQQQSPSILQQRRQPPSMLQQQAPSILQQQPPTLQQQPSMSQQQPTPMIQQQPPPLLQQQPPPLLQQQPPPLLQQQPPQLLQQQQVPAMLQQPPPMLQQQPPPMLQQQPPSMLQQQPPPMMQQQLPPMMQQQTPSMMQQQLMQGLNPPMLQSPFAMRPKMDPSVSLPNFMPPEPPPGLISFQ